MDRWKTVRRMGLSHESMLSFMFGTQTQSSTSGQAGSGSGFPSCMSVASTNSVALPFSFLF